ncbi:MAG: UTP--glucose-1-phosphate uridylyltransferase [Myxococcota bacterium]
MSDRDMTAEQLFDEVDETSQEILERNNFDVDEFLDLRERFLAGELGRDSNQIDGEVSAPEAEDVRGFPDRDSLEGKALIEKGKAALERGEVGALVLNGGMATRFGGVVKGCVDVFDELSFIGLKILDASRWDSDLLLMNSFATDQKTKGHLEAIDYLGHDPSRVHRFNQNISIRLTPSGSLFHDADGTVSLYAPGHGDLPTSIRRGALQNFLGNGGKYLLMSNVDNVLASLDPLVIGAHIDSEAQMTVECVQTKPGYKGGMVARVDGDPQVVEHFRIPESFDQNQLDLLNTNTFCFDAEALDDEFDLNWYVVEKEVDGKSVIQFERLAGELSAFLETRFLKVPNDGEQSRFLPIKRPVDLEDNREFLEKVIRARGFLN